MKDISHKREKAFHKRLETREDKHSLTKQNSFHPVYTNEPFESGKESILRKKREKGLKALVKVIEDYGIF